MTPRYRAQLLVGLAVTAAAVLGFPGIVTISSAGTPALMRLGESLFLDKHLSRNDDVSCASCHDPAHAFIDGKPVSIGTSHLAGTRNVPSLLNIGNGPFFWDGRTIRLKDVVTQPFTNPVEMGLTGSDDLLARLRARTSYRTAFGLAFPNAQHWPTIEMVQLALVCYLRSQESGMSPYDRYSRGDQGALLSNAKHGLALFQGNANCTECHRIDGPRAEFTDNTFHSTLISPQFAASLPATAVALARTPPGAQLGLEIESDPKISELGRYVVSQDPKDIGSFRTPSLRNVAQTAPYMHDGSVATLRDAVDREIYYRALQSNQPNTLTEKDRQDLVAFLQSLSDTLPPAR